MWLEKNRSGLVLFKLKKVLETWQITNTEPIEILNKYGYLIPLHWGTKMKGGITVIEGQIAAWPGRNSWELRHIKNHFTPSPVLIWVRKDEFLLALSFIDGWYWWPSGNRVFVALLLLREGPALVFFRLHFFFVLFIFSPFFPMQSQSHLALISRHLNDTVAC